MRRQGRDLRGYYFNAGPGPLGVFVHGFRSDCNGSKSLALAQHAIACGYSWLRFDLSGHGASDGDFRRFRLSAMLEDLLAVLDHVAERKLLLVGSSMGAWLSVLAAERRPQQVRGLVLLAAGFNFIQNALADVSHDEAARWARRGERRFEDRYGGDAYTLEHAVLADAAPFDVLGVPRELACPVVLLHGDQDEVVPAAVSQAFLQTVIAPEKRLQIIPGGDHRLNAAVPIIRGAVDELWPTGR